MKTLAISAFSLLMAAFVSSATAAESTGAKQALPLQAKNYSALLGTGILSNTLLSNHFKLYEGYIKNTNTLRDTLGKMVAEKKDKTPEYAELKRRFGWEYNGALLHELYFDNLGGSVELSTSSQLYAKISEDFGSFDAWKQDITATALMRGIGWAVLYWESRSGTLVNVWIDEHDRGHLTGATTLLVIDVFEHAYMPDYMSDRTKYLDNLFKHIYWKTVEERFQKR
jgi:Fe-Mn family superoxide dismutase